VIRSSVFEFQMRTPSHALCLLTTLAFIAFHSGPLRAQNATDEPAVTPKAAHFHYLRAGKPDAVALLAPPPLPGSPEQAADMATVRSVSRAAPESDTAMALSEKKFSVYTFAPEIGTFFQSSALPKTTAFFDRVQSDAEILTDNSKDFFKRPRPYTIDPTLASGKLEKSFSYPSGHSTESMVLALVLSELFPDKQDAIIARAREIGWHRVEIARHYPTDIYAGRVLARAIVHEMNARRRFRSGLEEARKEIDAALQAQKQQLESVAH